jgi:DNA-binding response OmpR family regulator
MLFRSHSIGGTHVQRILVIDDDPSLTSVLKRAFAFEGFSVDTAPTGPKGLALARDHAPDLVILDVMLPGIDGFEVLSRLRAADKDLPVMMLTARDGPPDQIKGLESGADDYVLKPFTFEVLAARVKSLLRRRETDHPDILRFSDLTLDTGTRCARRANRAIDLTATEYEVLRQFLLHPRRVLPKHFLMDRVWGYDMEGSSNVLEVYVKQIRQKLEEDAEPRLIHTFRGAGYVMREM